MSYDMKNTECVRSLLLACSTYIFNANDIVFLHTQSVILIYILPFLNICIVCLPACLIVINECTQTLVRKMLLIQFLHSFLSSFLCILSARVRIKRIHIVVSFCVRIITQKINSYCGRFCKAIEILALKYANQHGTR